MTSPRDAAAFAEFVQARSASLFRTAYLIVGDHGLAQDLLQESLAKTFQAWGRLREEQNAEAYTRRVLVTTAVSWRRRRSSGEQPAESLPESSTADLADRVADQDAVWRQVLTLPVRQRAALVLRFYEDLTDEQAATHLGCSAATIRSQVSQGLKRLRQELGVELITTRGEATT